MSEVCFLLSRMQSYREVFCDKVEKICPFSLLTSRVWHQYLQWYKDVYLGYNLQKRKM